MLHAIPAFDLVTAVLAGSTINVLVDVAALVGTAGLRRAWQTLGGMLACCIMLLMIHAALSFQHPANVQDLIGAAIFLIGASFILSTVWLSRSTARHLLRVERVAQVAHIDAVTGVGNRRHFDEQLDTAVNEAHRSNSHLSLISFDIDHFKAVNDAYGHAVGDEVLRQIARVSAERCRLAGTFFRVGGEEFSVIVPRTDPVFVQALAEQLRISVAAFRVEMRGGTKLSVTISLGLASLADEETGAEFLRRADTALYDAKRGGRDRVRIAV